ncbi:hypothetical protein Ancab_019193 [Ancistrocladus abbreviatus]
MSTHNFLLLYLFIWYVDQRRVAVKLGGLQWITKRTLGCVSSASSPLLPLSQKRVNTENSLFQGTDAVNWCTYKV